MPGAEGRWRASDGVPLAAAGLPRKPGVASKPEDRLHGAMRAARARRDASLRRSRCGARSQRHTSLPADHQQRGGMHCRRRTLRSAAS
eukprot:NODE_5607_length_569_cov_166.610895.p3 GENE.NODE_5607_length_569_cov_166.610895~~NODE_5607_length_569_cov_166.610895.p3  ORF type:complete len:88 (-),score=6.38 NODE_5607_length_569_cov_166.610895:23-286(-)